MADIGRHGSHGCIDPGLCVAEAFSNEVSSVFNSARCFGLSKPNESINPIYSGGRHMELENDIFEIFDKDANYRYIMKRLLEASMEESYNSIIISEAGPGYPIIYVNPAFSELTGYAPHEVLGKSPSILQGPKTDMEVIDRLNMDISHGKVFHGRAINYRKDGSEFIMQWKIAPIHNEKNEVTHYLAIQRMVLDPTVS
jgi:PAS domain S-box-containing protein